MTLLDRTIEVSLYLMKIMFPFGLVTVYLGYFSSIDVVAAPDLRVVGGNLTTIDRYPHAAVILYFTTLRPPIHICGGTILNERHVLTAAHCFGTILPSLIVPSEYLIRVGSSMAHSGGTTHIANRVIIHPARDSVTVDSDIAIIRTASHITYGRTVQPAYIAGENYKLADNEPIWAVGWGATVEHGNISEQLRHVQVLSVNRETCRSRYEKNTHIRITDNMLCSGWLGVGGRDQCTRDSGSPVYHHNVVVGISSMGLGCARPQFPGINVQVSRFANWIRNTTKPGTVLRHPVKLKSSPIKIYFNFDL